MPLSPWDVLYKRRFWLPDGGIAEEPATRVISVTTAPAPQTDPTRLYVVRYEPAVYRINWFIRPYHFIRATYI
jgi:hypothetical protein